MWKKSENNAARIYKDEHLIINTPYLNHHSWMNGVKELKTKNYEKLASFSETKRNMMLRRMVSIKGGACSTKKTDSWYTTFNANNYYGKIFYGGVDLGYNIVKLMSNANVTCIIVVEEQAEVLNLIKPILNTNNKVHYYCGDPLKVFPGNPYDFMIWTDFQYWLHDSGSVNITHNYLRQKYTQC